LTTLLHLGSVWLAVLWLFFSLEGEADTLFISSLCFFKGAFKAALWRSLRSAYAELFWQDSNLNTISISFHFLFLKQFRKPKLLDQ